MNKIGIVVVLSPATTREQWAGFARALRVASRFGRDNRALRGFALFDAAFAAAGVFTGKTAGWYVGGIRHLAGPAGRLPA